MCNVKLWIVNFLKVWNMMCFSKLRSFFLKCEVSQHWRVKFYESELWFISLNCERFLCTVKFFFWTVKIVWNEKFCSSELWRFFPNWEVFLRTVKIFSILWRFSPNCKKMLLLGFPVSYRSALNLRKFCTPSNP